MSDVKPIAPVRIGQTDIVYAQGMRAGSVAVLHRARGDRFRQRHRRAGRRHCRAAARRRAALFARGQIHLRPLREIDRRRRRRSAPYRARRSILSARRMRESLSARAQGAAQGIRAAEHLGADGRIAGRRRQHERVACSRCCRARAASRRRRGRTMSRCRSIPASSPRSSAATMSSSPARCRTTKR